MATSETCGFLGGSIRNPRQCVLPRGHLGFHAECLADDATAESLGNAWANAELDAEWKLVQMWAKRLGDPLYVNALQNLRLHVDRFEELLNRERKARHEPKRN